VVDEAVADPEPPRYRPVDLDRAVMIMKDHRLANQLRHTQERDECRTRAQVNVQDIDLRAPDPTRQAQGRSEGEPVTPVQHQHLDGAVELGRECRLVPRDTHRNTMSVTNGRVRDVDEHAFGASESKPVDHVQDMQPMHRLRRILDRAGLRCAE
jgi:hypothetical protein